MFICTNCQKTYSKWQGKCDSCGEWGTIEESVAPRAFTKTAKSKGSSKKSKVEFATPGDIRVFKFSELENDKEIRNELKSGIGEFDNALGGRLVQGQVILLSGEPGIGKSTLATQLTDAFSNQNLSVLYICGEESPYQVKQRIDRMGLKHDNVTLLQESDVSIVENYIATNSNNIDVIFVDSIQTLFDPDIASAGGSISQIGQCTNRITGLSKGYGLTTFIIGHVTKSGDIAGPKLMEHMVDTVLYFEGERTLELRILKVEKNRFGPTDEVALFKMSSQGLVEVVDTKELFDPNKIESPGSVYSMVLEGTRPIVLEVQALATKTYFSNPRRAASGFDLNRMFILLAIIDKKLKLNTGEYDVYVNITGGIKSNDRGLDLAIIKAIISSIKNEKISKEEIYFGEVGLTGEIRKVFLEEKRVKEAKRLGFDKVYYGKNYKL